MWRAGRRAPSKEPAAQLVMPLVEQQVYRAVEVCYVFFDKLKPAGHCELR